MYLKQDFGPYEFCAWDREIYFEEMKLRFFIGDRQNTFSGNATWNDIDQLDCLNILHAISAYIFWNPTLGEISLVQGTSPTKYS